MVEEASTILQDAYPTGTPNAPGATQAQVGEVRHLAPLPVPQPPVAQNSYATLFPYPNALRRISDYQYFMRLFMGEHWDAFNMRIGDEKYTREYSKLRYVMINFAGLVSKVVADMLFSEPVKFKSPNKDTKEQAFLDALVHENSLHIQNYESALSNSALGDAVYKVRIGERFKGDGKPTVIIEDITPSIYFPQVDGFNVRAEPNAKELAWTFTIGKNKYLRKEIHTRGLITNEAWSMEGDKVLIKQNVSILGSEMKDTEETLIDRSLIIHVPNWKTGNRYFGISDYYDIDKIFYAINNRMTKVDNILDKHSDPILMVPPGVLDEKGNVNKKSLGVIEVQDGETGKPEYIVWDASLENAFKEVEKLVESLFMIGEVSPDILGMGQGQSDSGRALKFKILRTIAKVARKKLYYDRQLKEVLYVAMLVAQAHKVQVGDLDPVTPFVPDTEWQDGLPMDMFEQTDIETKRLDAGNTTVEDSIMRLDGVDEDTAKKKAEQIKKENSVAMPSSKLSAPFGPNAGADLGGKTNMDGKSMMDTNPADAGKGATK